VRPIGPITQRPTNPAITNPNVSIGGGPAPIQQPGNTFPNTYFNLPSPGSLPGGKSSPAPAPIQQPPVAQPGGPFTPTPGSDPGIVFGPAPLGRIYATTGGGPAPIQQPGRPSMGFGAEAPIGQETNPQYQNYSNYQGPAPIQQPPVAQPGGPMVLGPYYGPARLEQNSLALLQQQPGLPSTGMGGGKSMGGQQQPGITPQDAYNQYANTVFGGGDPRYQPNFTQPAPVSGGFNPMAGNTTLPGNF
jgi:hypothetical protein